MEKTNLHLVCIACKMVPELTKLNFVSFLCTHTCRSPSDTRLHGTDTVILWMLKKVRNQDLMGEVVLLWRLCVW